jgi:hypothetical protein
MQLLLDNSNGMQKFAGMRDFKSDKALADRAAGLIYEALLTVPGLEGGTMREATLEEDQMDATDYVFKRAHGGAEVKISARVRKYESTFERFWNQFTVRVARVTGATTEFEKIMAGKGDLGFYGILNRAETAFAVWSVIDWHNFRTQIKSGGLKARESVMCDESFLAYNLFDGLHYPNVVLHSSLSLCEPQF